MKNTKLNYFVFIGILLGVFSCKSIESKVNKKSTLNIEKRMKYPETFRDNEIVDDFFGKKVKDPYRWLEDDNSKKTEDWVNRQIRFTENYLSKIPFREKIKNDLTKIVNYERFSIPIINNDKLFIYRNSGLQNQSVFYEIDPKGNIVKEILNPNEFSKDGTKAIDGISFSENGDYLGYLVSESGADWKTSYVLDMKTNKLLKDSVKWIKFSGLSWYKDGFFYSRYPNSKDGKLSNENKNHKLYYHKLNTNQEEDVLWYEDRENPNRNIYAGTSNDERFLVLSKNESTSGNAFSIIDLESKDKKEIIIIDDFISDFNLIDNIGDDLLILTNRDAKNSKVLKININNVGEDNWKTIINEEEDPIQSVRIIDNMLFVTYLHNAYSLVKVFDLEGKFIRKIEFPGIGTLSGLSGKKDKTKGYLSYSSYTIPRGIYEFDTKDFKLKEFKTPKIDFNQDEFITKQIWYESKDGTSIPMFVTHKKSLTLDGNNPTILYGYGGFNISITPSFSVSKLLFMKKGGVYVVANIRGGGEFGEKWHEGGVLENKQNVFDDFISAAEYLIDNKYTSSKYLAIEGGSNGGLLVGACLTQRPDLFGVAFPKVGVLDMLRYHKFTIGWAWATDYGKSDNEKAFNYLIKYSPLHNVKNIKYPATLVFTADHDDRVVPAHSFKFISELQYKQIGEKPVLIRIGKKAGHGAGKPVSKIIEELADMYSFLFYNMNLEY